MFRRVAVMVVVMCGIAAAQPAGPGTKAVKQANDTVAALLKKNAPPADVIKAIGTFFDIDALGRASMSTHWSKLSAKDQTDFLKVFRELIETNYLSVQQGNAQYTTVYHGESTNPAGNIVVKTEIKATRKNRPITIAVDYELVKKGTSLQILDVVQDGAGLIANYQTTFNKTMASKGFTGVMTAMQNKLAEIKKKP